jgi:signal transduction histidine kinase
MRGNWSLGWRVTVGLMIFQALTLLAVAWLGIALAFKATSGGVVVHPRLPVSIARSLVRDANGRIGLAPTSQLREFMSASPGLWIIARSPDGEELTYGPVPDVTSAVMALANDIRTIDIRATDRADYLTSRFDNLDTAVGRATIWTGGGGFLSDVDAVLRLGGIAVILPVLALIVLTVIGVPLVIHFSLRSVKQVASQIDQIDYEARGTQIEGGQLPREILPMVRGMNKALLRIDAGSELTERFFVNAAHELRTPIAILQVRLEVLDPGPETDKFKLIVRRLAVLVKQLLDIETFRQNPPERRLVDLGKIVAEAIADLAPYAVAEGYTISLDCPEDPVWVNGDAAALDRMFVNLIQNAVQHGGKKGSISVRVAESGVIEVEDQGPGIDHAKRDLIFEAFYRFTPHGSGAGLGLKMVRDIARAHGGEVVLEPETGVGSRFVVSLPVHNQHESGQQPSRSQAGRSP